MVPYAAEEVSALAFAELSYGHLHCILARVSLSYLDCVPVTWMKLHRSLCTRDAVSSYSTQAGQVSAEEQIGCNALAEKKVVWERISLLC